MSKIEKFRCPTCQKLYITPDLVRFKCSENTVGGYMIEHCPSCLRKKKYSRLEKITEETE